MKSPTGIGLESLPPSATYEAVREKCIMKTSYMVARAAKQIDVLAVPNYGPIEAAAFLHVPYDTLHYWISPESGPLVTPASKRPLLLSFKNLVECYVLEILRRIHGISMPKVRFSVDTLKALQRAMHIMSSAHPLADHDLRIAEKEKKLFIYDLHGACVELTKGGQVQFPNTVDAYLRRIVRDGEGVAFRFHPLLKRYTSFKEANLDPEVIVVDPKVYFGKPVLVGSRISTEVIAGRLYAGDPEEELAQEYGRTLAEIRAAAQFEGIPATA